MYNSGRKTTSAKGETAAGGGGESQGRIEKKTNSAAGWSSHGQWGTGKIELVRSFWSLPLCWWLWHMQYMPDLKQNNFLSTSTISTGNFLRVYMHVPPVKVFSWTYILSVFNLSCPLFLRFLLLSSCVRSRRRTCWLKRPRSQRRRPSCWPRKLPRLRQRCSVSKWLPSVARKSGDSWNRRCWRQRWWPSRWPRSPKGGGEKKKEDWVDKCRVCPAVETIQCICLALWLWLNKQHFTQILSLCIHIKHLHTVHHFQI